MSRLKTLANEKISKQEQGKRLYQAIQRLALQAGENTDELIDWLCGEHGGMAKLFESYFSPKEKWAVFCGVCRKEWNVPYQHPGKSICHECHKKLKDHNET